MPQSPEEFVAFASGRTMPLLRRSSDPSSCFCFLPFPAERVLSSACKESSDHWCSNCSACAALVELPVERSGLYGRLDALPRQWWQPEAIYFAWERQTSCVQSASLALRSRCKRPRLYVVHILLNQVWQCHFPKLHVHVVC